ncbi:MAG: Uma2 family endonuclease, partial [Saprospiraceae bacterium]
PIMKQYLDFPPALVVEILSPSTEMKDRNTKYQWYETFGIRYYVMIDPDKDAVEIFELDSDGKYQLIKDMKHPIILDANCTITPAWDEVFLD